MDWAQTTTRTFDLGYEQLLTFLGRPGTRVRVLYGAMWLTEEGRTQDIFAGCGDEVTLRSGGLSVIEGLGVARVQVIDPGRRRWPGLIAKRLGNAWRRLRSGVRVREALARSVIVVLAIAVSLAVLHLAAPGPLLVQGNVSENLQSQQQPGGAAGVLHDVASARTGFLAVN
jgi:hypothetical protein